MSFDSKNLLSNNVFNALSKTEKETFKKAFSNNDMTQVKSLKEKYSKAWKRNRPHDDPGKVINISKSTRINRSQWLSIDDVTDYDDQSKDDNVSVDSTDIDDNDTEQDGPRVRRWNCFEQWITDKPENREAFSVENST